MKKKQPQPYSLRLDPEVKLAVEKQAKKERRSMNAWLQIAVEEKLVRAERQEVRA